MSGAAKPVHWTGEPHAVVNLKLDFDGGITLLTGASDIGQGSSTLLAQIVAEVLGVGLERITRGRERQPADAEGQRLLLLARVVHGRQRRDRRGARAEAGAARGRGAQARGSRADVECLGETYRVPGTDRTLSYKEVVAAALEDGGTLIVKGT